MEQKINLQTEEIPAFMRRGEDYLEAVLVLQRKKGMVRSVDVARHMGVSKPSVCHAVATLKEGRLPHHGRGLLPPPDRCGQGGSRTDL